VISFEGAIDTAGEGLVDAGLILELRMLGLDRLELDSNFLARDDVGSEVDIAKRAGSDLAADTVLVTDAKILHELATIFVQRAYSAMAPRAWSFMVGEPRIFGHWNGCSSLAKK
jgi:hypothetical protein